ncbi:MAG: transposase [Candidatus Thorarchaeota archaeon]
MKYNSADSRTRQDKHHRKSIRIPGYDYSQDGWYFITICTYQRERLFGDILDGVMILNAFGNIVKTRWNMIPEHFPHVDLDEYIIMPNHIHGIMVINNRNVGAKNFSPLQNHISTKFESPSKTIGSIVRGFKIGVTKWFRKNTDIYTIWQRNYWEHLPCEILLLKIKSYGISSLSHRVNSRRKRFNSYPRIYLPANWRGYQQSLKMAGR